MKLFELIDDQENLNEMSSLINFIGSIAKKYHSKIGTYEMRVAINKNMAQFSRLMSRYNMSWKTLTMFALYHFFRNGLNLDDNDIIDVINTGIGDQKSQKISKGYVIDKNKRNPFIALLKNKTPNDQYIEDIVDKIMAAAILRSSERNDERQSGVNPHGISKNKKNGNNQSNTNQSTTNTAQSQNAQNQSQPATATSSTSNIVYNNYNAPAVSKPSRNARSDFIKSRVLDILSQKNGKDGIKRAIDYLTDEMDKLDNKPVPQNSISAKKDSNGNWEI